MKIELFLHLVFVSFTSKEALWNSLYNLSKLSSFFLKNSPSFIICLAFFAKIDIRSQSFVITLIYGMKAYLYVINYFLSRSFLCEGYHQCIEMSDCCLNGVKHNLLAIAFATFCSDDSADRYFFHMSTGRAYTG